MRQPRKSQAWQGAAGPAQPLQGMETQQQSAEIGAIGEGCIDGSCSGFHACIRDVSCTGRLMEQILHWVT